MGSLLFIPLIRKLSRKILIVTTALTMAAALFLLGKGTTTRGGGSSVPSAMVHGLPVEVLYNMCLFLRVMIDQDGPLS